MVPATLRASFVMIEAEPVSGGLEAVFDRPAVAFDGESQAKLCPRRRLT
jgi:hypothetical protein